MTLPSAPPRTGLPDFDQARWRHPVLAQDVLPLRGVGLLRQGFPAAGPRFEVAVPALSRNVLVWVLDAAPGGYEARLDGRQRLAPGGRLHDGYLLPAGMESRWAGPMSRRHDVLHLHMDVAWMRGLAAESGLPDSAALLAPRAGLGDPRLASLVRALLGERALHGTLSAAFAEQWAVLAALRLMRGAKLPERVRIAPWRLARLREMVAARLGEEITLAEMADVAGLSRFHFARAFNAETGESPHAWLRRLRCEHAKDLMLEAGLPLAEVAGRCGFAHQAHFTTTFRRVVGTSPGRWRAERLS